jgi:rhamnosyl/mannosyltransferase
LGRILDEPALAERLGAAGRERAKNEFDQAVFRGRMATIYEEAVLARKYRGTARR